MLVVFLAIWFFSPLVTAGITQWPAWLRDSNMQFLLGTLISLILAFNPGTTRLVRNTAAIKGSDNRVIQGTRTSGNDASVTNLAKITGDHNRVEQG